MTILIQKIWPPDELPDRDFTEIVRLAEGGQLTPSLRRVWDAHQSQALSPMPGGPNGYMNRETGLYCKFETLDDDTIIVATISHFSKLINGCPVLYPLRVYINQIVFGEIRDDRRLTDRRKYIVGIGMLFGSPINVYCHVISPDMGKLSVAFATGDKYPGVNHRIDQTLFRIITKPEDYAVLKEEFDKIAPAVRTPDTPPRHNAATGLSSDAPRRMLNLGQPLANFHATFGFSLADPCENCPAKP